MVSDTFAFSVGNVLCDGAGELAVVANENISQAFGAALLCPVLPGVQLTSRLGGSALHDDCANVGVLEDTECGVSEELRALNNLDVEPEVRLVRPVVLHGVGVGHAGDRSRNVVPDLFPNGGEDFLGDANDIVLVDEAHLDVELRELRLTISAEIFVAVAACNLEIPFHAANHQQLLKQLRRLRKSIERART